MSETPPNRERILKGEQIVAAARKAGASYVEQAFTLLEGQLDTVIKGNAPNPEMNHQIEELTKTILKQLQHRLSNVFSDATADQPGDGVAGTGKEARRKSRNEG